MNIRTSAMAGLLASALVAGCSDHVGVGRSVAGRANGSGSDGRCSDPHPSPMELTFAGVVCVLKTTRVPQTDGSVELELTVSVTDKEPDSFGVRTWDFAILDTAGHDLQVEDAKSAGRTGGARCLYQDFSDDGWPVKQGETFTMPSPMCFNVAPDEHPDRLVWQDDVSVPLRS
jgi:hypothetical protein